MLKANNPEFRDRIEQTNLLDLDPAKLTPEILDKLAEHLMNKALGGDQRAVAECRRQLEAGQEPTIESVHAALKAT